MQREHIARMRSGQGQRGPFLCTLHLVRFGAASPFDEADYERLGCKLSPVLPLASFLLFLPSFPSPPAAGCMCL